MKSKVYFTKEITSDSLLKIYESLNTELKGRVAVKISTGEPGGHNFLNPDLIKGLVGKVNGTIVECLTAYEGKRDTLTDHLQTLENHGFKSIANCDILDSDGEIELKFEGGKHLHGTNYVGKNIENYDSMLVLSHFKGHQMAGFGGALKNIAIGLASKNGKAWIHSVGRTTDPNEMWSFIDNQISSIKNKEQMDEEGSKEQIGFLESMAEASKSVIEYFGKENILYINVLNNLSIDCDCSPNPTTPQMKNIGIVASTNPVALDMASLDLVYNSEDLGKASLINRIEERQGKHIIKASEELGLGSSHYDLINID